MIAVTLVLALMIPLVTTAAVVVSNNVTITTNNSHSNMVYLTEGPGYNYANSSGYIGIIGNNSKYTNETVDISTIPGSGYVVMTNVLAVYNNSSTVNPLYVWFNGTIPSGVQLFYSNNLMTFNGSSVSGIAMSSGNNGPIHLTSKGDALYISIIVTSVMPESFMLNMQQE
jgi:hypothetical protein